MKAQKQLYLKRIKGAVISIVIGLCLNLLSCEKEDIVSDNIKEVNLPDITGYPIIETNQKTFYNNFFEISEPQSGSDFYGQDATYDGNKSQYIDNGDGTITDMITGLMWQQDPGSKMTYIEAKEGESSFNLAGYTDWRLPTIKEIYSLMDFSGSDPSSYQGTSTDELTPYINTNYFIFEYGDISNGERLIDAQYATSTIYTSTTMGGNKTMFGLNLADGRIKGYPIETTGIIEKEYFVLHVRGRNTYGINNFIDNGDGTISDSATGLMWQTTDSDVGMSWEEALKYAESLEYAGYSDWRLPNAKELQSIVDYTRSPDATNSPAINELFSCTEIINEGGDDDYPYYWTSTTHSSWDLSASNAAYICFGRALGYFNNQWQDVHGAGAQRSDPKKGDASDYPYGHGPQGDAIRCNNYVRLVRNIE